MLTLELSSYSDKRSDFYRLFHLWNKVLNYINGEASAKAIILDFTRCEFISHGAVAFIGGMIRVIESYSVTVSIKWETIPKHVRANLDQNGFSFAFGSGIAPHIGNSVPYREDTVKNSPQIMNYLKNNWLGRDWVHVSKRLQVAIVGRVWEIYENAFEHSDSPVGVITCGQRYPIRSELTLTVIDFGIGIPNRVNSFYDNRLGTVEALKWAFTQGKTTKPGKHITQSPGGLGLGLLKSFIKTNKGKLEVFSNDGYVLISKNKEEFIGNNIPFNGTILNIVFSCDDTYYCFANEVNDKEPLF